MTLCRPLPQKTKGVKHYNCDKLTLYENVPARVGESRGIEENRLQDDLPYPRRGDVKANELKIMLAPYFPLNNLKPGDWVLIPWGVRPNTASPIPVLPNMGPNIWINTPTGPELLTWTCNADGTCSFLGAVEIYLNEDGFWYLVYDGQEFQFSNTNFLCSEFPEGYSFEQTTGPDAVFKILKMDRKEDHLCRLSHYNLFVEFLDQCGVCIQ